MTESDEDIERLQFKIILIGDGAVGKTSLTRRFTTDDFKTSYLQTIGVDWFMKTVMLPDNIEVTLQIWDIGGQQLGSKLLSNYLFGSDAVLLCYDITNYMSYKNLQDWYSFVHTVFKDKLPLIGLVGNKCDLEHLRTVRKELHERWAQDNNFKSFFVSAKTGDKVQTMFVKFASYLAQVSLSKDDIEASGKVVKAEIINYPLVDAENEKANEEAKKAAASKKKSLCIIS